MQLGLFESGARRPATKVELTYPAGSGHCGTDTSIEAASAGLGAVFPNHPGHAATDRSIEAANAVVSVADTLRANVMRVLGEEPLTVHAAAERLDLSVPSVQPRFSELKRMGKIEDSGKRRVNQVSGKKAIVWQVRV